MASPTYYDILSLPSTLRTSSPIPTQTLRSAYRRALLQNHPDKFSPSRLSKPSKSYTIDQITHAFTVLCSPEARAEYDLQLQCYKQGDREGGRGGEKANVEIVDLDDLRSEGGLEGKGEVWWRECRCGDEKGFEVREEDLERFEAEGEVLVGCKRCSLWLRVLFGVVDS
ncbi:diphthamide biosynthesis protein-like protein 4 [Calycina marina]|uniref:Diphthamide biosynthesis protein 4 n=1 Tax=Calycina marina TaxID=1763456 RepID=A0A9P7Z0R5_9HELO|nr:diphthamide biosynthesis protein-like protein 4 [Calycina marina]